MKKYIIGFAILAVVAVALGVTVVAVIHKFSGGTTHLSSTAISPAANTPESSNFAQNEMSVFRRNVVNPDVARVLDEYKDHSNNGSYLKGSMKFTIGFPVVFNKFAEIVGVNTRVGKEYSIESGKYSVRYFITKQKGYYAAVISAYAPKGYSPPNGDKQSDAGLQAVCFDIFTQAKESDKYAMDMAFIPMPVFYMATLTPFESISGLVARFNQFMTADFDARTPLWDSAFIEDGELFYFQRNYNANTLFMHIAAMITAVPEEELEEISRIRRREIVEKGDLFLNM